ncbi:hypothetical protein Bmyc01_61630 [Bacillus mycoides]|nr:hypothetical protein Bmyc01_61630 [Bacillus mycoides]
MPDTIRLVLFILIAISAVFSLLNYSPLNILADCLKWEIPKYRNLTVSNSLGYPRSSYG